MLDGTPAAFDGRGPDRHIHRPLERRRGGLKVSSEQEENSTNIHHTCNCSETHPAKPAAKSKAASILNFESDSKLGIFPCRTFNINRQSKLFPQLGPFLKLNAQKGSMPTCCHLGRRSLSIIGPAVPSRSWQSFVRVFDLERRTRTGASALSSAGHRLVKNFWDSKGRLY